MKRLLISLAAMGAIPGCMPYGRSASLEAPSDLPEAYAPSRTQAVAVPGSSAPVALPEPALGEAEPRASHAKTGNWWSAFEDPALSELVQRALSRNLDLRVAFARLEQARAMSSQVEASRWPQVSGQGQASWNRSQNAFLGAAAETTTLRASLPVSYEVDWFAQHATRASASRHDIAAARADVEAAAMTIAAQVAEAWFDVLDARARRDALAEQLKINDTFLELTTLRFRQGLTPVLDAYQQRQQVAATRAQLELVTAAETVSLNRLAVLTGETPGNKVYAPERATLPPLPQTTESGVPADLLEQRPDIRAAARRVKAADERVAVALAARLPSLVISGGPGYTWTHFAVPGPFGGTVHGPEYNAGATINIPLFDGFQRSAQIDLDRARVREALDSYRKSIQQAVFEVQSALVQERRQREHILALEEQLEAARGALESGRDRYRQGLSDFLPVLTGLQGVQQTELALIGARRQLLSYRVQLHRALGGKWAERIEAPRSNETSR